MIKRVLKYDIFILGIVLCIPFFSYGQYRVKPHDLNRKITALTLAKDGRLLYGTQDGDIGYYDGVQMNKLLNVHGKINRIERVDNEIHLMTSGGYYVYSSGSLKPISGNTIDVLDVDISGSYLLSTRGVYIKEGNDYIPDNSYFFAHGDILDGSILKVGKELTIHENNHIHALGKRWNERLSHEDDIISVAQWDDKRMIVGDSSSYVFFDVNGYVDTLFVHNSDLGKSMKIDKSKALLLYDNRVVIFDINKKERQEIYSINTELIRSFIKDDWGNIWICAGSYLYQITDQSDTKAGSPPSVFIKEIKLDGKRQELKSSVRIDDASSDLEIQYMGVQMARPQDLEYQTRLVKVQQSQDETGWSELSKKTIVEYRGLEAGRYKFELRSTINGKQFQFAAPVEVVVNDNTILWVWLTGILGALGILVSALLFQLRYNRLKEKSFNERQLLRQKNEVLTLQQKSLQLQMNPHFIFNSLNSIQGLIVKEDNKRARKYLREFSILMRSVLNQSREESINIEDEIRYLKSYLNLEQMANNDQFDFEISKEISVSEEAEIPTMLIQPFIENSIIHGVKGLTNRRGKINVHFSMLNHLIICEVSDNGVGRKGSTRTKHESSHKSVAVDLARERLKKRLRNKSLDPVQYTDIIEKGIVEGTKVKLLIG